MSIKKFNRVVFYSNRDMSIGGHLVRGEQILNEVNLENEFDINDLLEFYHIKLFLDNDVYLLSWSDEEKTRLKKISGNLFELLRKQWLEINDNNIADILTTVEFSYQESFWDLLGYFQNYKCISKNKFSCVLDRFPRQIIYVLSSANLTNYFSNEIRAFLLNYKNTAELLLSKIEEKHKYNTPKYSFPKNLSLNDREEIISKYLESENANLNYVGLIVKSKDSVDLKLSAKIRLKAKKKGEELNKEILEKGHTWREGIKISILDNQNEPVIYKKEGHILEVNYSLNYFDSLTNPIELFGVFSTLFEYVDSDNLITLVSKESEREVLERILMESKNEYPTGYAFSAKNRISHIQLLMFKDYLTKRGSSVENLIDDFLNEFLKPKFNINELRLELPSKDLTYLEKIRVLAPEFDSILKQYQIFALEGFIDFELLELDSKQLFFSEIKSLGDKKYAYIKDNKVLYLKYQFFSDQSGLYYVERFEKKHTNLYSLLTSENVLISDFQNYQVDEINKLVEEKYLRIDSNNYVIIEKDIFLIIIGLLHKNEVISYWQLPIFIRAVVDEMVNSDLLYFENTLFTIQEQKFFNFYLNKKEFTNGHDLRNKYLHGTNTSSTEEQGHEYYILLKLLILILLKIEEDLIINEYLKNGV